MFGFAVSELRSTLGFKSGAEERTRTSTGLPPPAPEAGVSTNFTTSAVMARNLLIPRILVNDFAKKNFDLGILSPLSPSNLNDDPWKINK